jgi:PPP family 3-phenylpropionic acid transporter
VEKQDKKEKDPLVSDIHFLRDYRLWMGLILMQMSFGAFYNFFTIYATAHGISLETTIYLWSFGVLVEIVMLYSQGNFLKGNLLLIIEITALITAFRWLLVYLFSDNIPVLYFSQSLHAFSFALFHSATIAYLFNLYKHKALAQQFFSGIAYGLGGLSGAILSGYIYEYYPSYLFLSSAFIAFLAFGFFELRRREVKN